MSRTLKDPPYYLEMPGGYEDGWSKWNPHDAKCHVCGSPDLEFFWDNGIVIAIHCLGCDVEEYGK